MRHSHYGDLQGEFTGSASEFFKRAWWLWLATPFALVLFPLFPFVYAPFKAIEWRWWLSGLRFGDVRVESTLPRGALIHLYWKVIGWYVLSCLRARHLFRRLRRIASLVTGALRARCRSPTCFRKTFRF